jgi:hypothetical protein
MKFEYTRPEDTKLEAYGKVFDIPPKTAPLVDGVNSINKQIAEGNAAQQAAALREGIALFIGEEAAEEIFSKAKLDSINIDEMSALWFVLNDISNKETEAVIAKYAPKPRNEIRVSSNPKK